MLRSRDSAWLAKEDCPKKLDEIDAPLMLTPEEPSGRRPEKFNAGKDAQYDGKFS